MTKKIFRAIFAVALVVLAAGMAIAVTFLYGYFNNYQVKQLKAELFLVADTVNKVGVEYFENFDSAVFRFTVVDRYGAVLYDTEADAAQMGNHLDREEIREAFEKGQGSSSRNSSTLTKKTYYEAVLLESGDVLRISVSRLTPGALVLAMLPAISAVLAVAAAVAFILSRAMAKKITEPLMQLDLESPPEKAAYEELTPILNKIGNQHRQIKRQMNELSQRSEEFEQIVASMNEGLVLLDENGTVLTMNPAAKKIFDVSKDVRGTDFFLVDTTGKMSRTVWNALDGCHGEYTEERNGCEYSFRVNPIISEARVLGAVILAFDITDKAHGERNRREFTANVTHELKTPLQSIIGIAELLEAGLVKPQDRERFAKNIRKEAIRLVDLINDIIRLSRLDEGQAPPRERVDVRAVVNEAVEVLLPVADEKGVKIITEGECELYGVRRYIYDIIYNLCDNGIKYTPRGGEVKICLEGGEKCVISVRDTGIGIPKEHQGRIFERFYRVDKSHSKETGGTGLGLSIVKHAVQHHGGRIILESAPGEGTLVRVEI